MATMQNNENAKVQPPRTGWFVLRAISGKEGKVKEVLEASMKNTDLGNYLHEVLIPTEKVYTTRNGKKVVKDRTLYSGYVFVKCTLTGEVQYELRNTTNVIDFLRGRSKTSEPEMLTEPEVERMLGRQDENSHIVEDLENEFLPGEPVKVTGGAFSGFSGTVKEVLSDRGKVKVEVKIFDRLTDLELESTQVSKE